VQYGQVSPGDVVAVIGSGPVGLSAVMTARLYGPSKIIAVDLDSARLKRASDFGATDTVNSGDSDWKEQVLALTDGAGVDVAIEAVGVPATFTMATEIVRPEAMSPTLACTASQLTWRSTNCGSRTSTSRWDLSTPTRWHVAQAGGRAQAARGEVRHPRIQLRSND